MPIFYTFVNE